MLILALFLSINLIIFTLSTTYDTNAIRYVSKKLALKLLLILQGDFNNPELQNVIGEEFGFILFLPAYVIAHSVNIINKNLTIFNVDNLFLTEDALINFCAYCIKCLYNCCIIFCVQIIIKFF